MAISRFVLKRDSLLIVFVGSKMFLFCPLRERFEGDRQKSLYLRGLGGVSARHFQLVFGRPQCDLSQEWKYGETGGPDTRNRFDRECLAEKTKTKDTQQEMS